ncbi:MAG: ComF family protein [Planctomycetes bacterium]|nr:ComF family protein [Planctomycetota bacterium]MBI3835970.1 ComF family protein [Planctomycetota bacterium]
MMNVASPIHRIINGGVNLLFPPRCLACGAHAGLLSDSMCADCASSIEISRSEKACPTCAATVALYEVAKNRCSECRTSKPKIRGMVRVAAYRSTIGGLVRAYKYHARDDLEPFLANWLADALAAALWIDRVEAVVSVPTHWKRRIARPFHAADAIAAHVAKKLGLPHVPLLRRVKAGPHQVGLSFAARIENVRGAFALRRGVTLNKPRLLLIDDVRTSGATLNECAKVLHRAGAGEIYAAIVVHAGFVHQGSKTLEVI